MLKNKIKVFFIVLFCFVFVGVTYCKSDSAYDELRKMVDILEIIDSKYVEEINNKDLVISAIKGMFKSLDVYSVYMTEKEYNSIKNGLKGSFGGVGLRLNTKNKELIVIAPMIDTPAYKAGILPGDKIIKIDGKETKELSSDKSIELMRGNPGTKVVLTIYRPSTKKELEFVLKRKKIKIEIISTKILENNIGYIRLTEFNSQCSTDIANILKKDFKNKIKALIFDLRNNPGGLVDSAVNTCSLFIKEGSLVVSTKCKDKTLEQQFCTEDKPICTDLPMIILINGYSASASEIVTGTLQDYKRALVIGSNSFGKGLVQKIMALSDGSAVKLTFAKYCLPSGRMITHSNDKKLKDKNGLTPDIYIKVPLEIEGKLYMQAEMDKLPKEKQPKKLIADKVLETAIKIIKENKVQTYIDNHTQYLKDYPSENKDDKNDDKENKQENDVDSENEEQEKQDDKKPDSKNKIKENKQENDVDSENEKQEKQNDKESDSKSEIKENKQEKNIDYNVKKQKQKKNKKKSKSKIKSKAKENNLEKNKE